MSIILPEEVLNKNKCARCKNYLSSGPIKKTREKTSDIICGRVECSSSTQIKPSFYDKIANFALFPCINRYEGCYKLLQYKNVVEHETNCTGNNYPCPMCPSVGTRSLLSLVDHYEANHAEYVLTKPKICINPEEIQTKHFLYCDKVNNCLFILYVECDGERILLNASVAGNKAREIKQTMDKVDYKRFCTEFDNNGEVFEIKVDKKKQQNMFSCEFEFEISHIPALLFESNSHSKKNFPIGIFGEEFVVNHGPIEDDQYALSKCLTKLVNLKDLTSLNLKCSFCENYFWDCEWSKVPKQAVYACSECSWIICHGCYHRGYQMCTKDKKRFESVVHYKLLDMQFYCRYNCGLFFNISQLKSHEEICSNFSDHKNVPQHFKKGNIITAKTNYYSKQFAISMLTHTGQKCIISYKLVENPPNDPHLKYEISHYDKSKFYPVIRICENGIMREETNTFYVNLRVEKQEGRSRTYYSDYFFVVLFKERKTLPMKLIKTINLNNI